jgi:protein gp37
VNCYADTWATRTGHPDLWRRHGERRFFGDKHWAEPVAWNRKAEAAGVRRRVFCASMADVFERHPDTDVGAEIGHARQRLLRLIEHTTSLDWLLLTKRPENILEMVTPRWQFMGFPPNVWIGTSVEDQQRADERIPYLLEIPAAVRFLSCEPLLSEVDLSDAIWPRDGGHGTRRVDWVIVGGESGPKARVMEVRWARSVAKQCGDRAAFFMKQMGSVWAKDHHAKDAKGEDPDEWPEDLRVREFPMPQAVPA